MKNILILLACIFGLIKINAQNKLDIAIQNLEENYSQEKVYILFDREKYVAGDDIFFKSFIFDGYSLSTISNTLFIELYDRNKNLIDKKNILIKKGQGNGSFTLNKNLDENIYFVRAYTSWMANFDEKWNFIKPIPIYNQTSKKKLVQTKNEKWSINSFPEGGTFIDGISTKVAVRLYSNRNEAIKWNGYVIDEDNPNEKIAIFKSLDGNVATFNMTPKFGKKYKIIAEDDKGNQQTCTLPSVSDKGISLQVVTKKEGLQYTLQAINLENNLKNYNVIGIINNQLAYKAKLESKKPQISSTIPTNITDKNGILQLYIFDEKENLVTQRLSFIKPENFKIDEPKFDSEVLNNEPRTLNSFDISPSSNYQNYTVLIKDVTDSDTFSKENILSNLYITEDFKTNINSPAKYFSKDSNPDVLDALLITEKWQRFDWKEILSGKKPVIKHNSTENQYISYKARLAFNGGPLANTSVNLVFKSEDEEPFLSQYNTDKNGEVFIYNVNFDKPHSVNYYIDSENKKRENLTLTFKPFIETLINKLSFPEINYSLEEFDNNYTAPITVERALINAKNNETIDNDMIKIEEVKLIKKKSDSKKKLNDKLSTGAFSSMNSTIFDFINENEDVASYSNIMQWLQGRAPGLTFKIDNSGNTVPYMRGFPSGIYLDEMKTDIEAINALSVNDIAMVKVIRENILVPNAVAIYTKRGSMGKENKSKDIPNKTILNGYDYAIEFKNINNDFYKKISKDTRELLYWNPNLRQPAKVEFFNNDDAKNREITIISFDKDDKILYYNEVK